MRKETDMMKTAETFVFISTFAVFFSVATASDKIHNNCGYGYINLGDECYPIPYSETGIAGATCTASQDCLLELHCTNNKCVDPCEEHKGYLHVDCRAVNHVADYTCHTGFRASEDYEYFCQRLPFYACQTNADCSGSHICDTYNDCVDACKKYFDPNADCVTENHELKLTCHAGYELIPCTFHCEKTTGANDTGVEGAQCSDSADCLSSLTCWGRKCTDPCKGYRNCLTVNHIARNVWCLNATH